MLCHWWAEEDCNFVIKYLFLWSPIQIPRLGMDILTMIRYQVIVLGHKSSSVG